MLPVIGRICRPRTNHGRRPPSPRPRIRFDSHHALDCARPQALGVPEYADATPVAVGSQVSEVVSPKVIDSPRADEGAACGRGPRRGH